jgi:hypothetical protein
MTPLKSTRLTIDKGLVVDIHNKHWKENKKLLYAHFSYMYVVGYENKCLNACSCYKKKWKAWNRVWLATSILLSICGWKSVENWNWQPRKFHNACQKWMTKIDSLFDKMMHVSECSQTYKKKLNIPLEKNLWFWDK